MNGISSNQMKAGMHYRIRLRLSAAQMTAFYAGQVRYVWSRDEHGRSVQFPLASLRPFVDHNGVNGVFELTVDSGHRLQGIRRLSHLA